MQPKQERCTCAVGTLAGLGLTALLLVVVPGDPRLTLETDVALFVPTLTTPTTTPTTPTTTPTTPPAPTAPPPAALTAPPPAPTTPTTMPTAPPLTAPTSPGAPVSQPPPCFSDPSHANLATLLDLEGEWLDTPQYHAPYTFRPQDCHKYGGNLAKPFNAVPSPKAFAPFACRLGRFSPSEFVRLLHDQTLFVLGDSLSSYFSNALFCLVAEPQTMAVARQSLQRPPGAQNLVCTVFTDSAAKPSRTARVCYYRMDQEIGVGVWVLNSRGLLKPNDVVLANTGRHKIDHSPAELHRLIDQMPEDIRGDGDTNSIDSRIRRFRKAHEFVTSEFKRKGLQPPLFLYRTTYAAKYVNGDWEPNGSNRRCTSDPKWAGLEKQRRVGLEQARQAGLDTLDPFMASTLVNLTEYYQRGDCSHFGQSSVYIYTAELLLAYLKYRR